MDKPRVKSKLKLSRRGYTIRGTKLTASARRCSKCI